jgi:hypothetical protein
LGAVTDPGTDTVSSYIIDWGDGSAAQAVGAAGNVTHTFASAATRRSRYRWWTKTVTFANAGSKSLTCQYGRRRPSLEAGGAAALDEGATFAHAPSTSPMATDNGAAGWSLQHRLWRRKCTVVNGSTLVQEP